MSLEPYLLVVAQLALGVAGFSGIVSVFRRSEAGWTPQDFVGLRFILDCCCAAMLLSLLPPALFRWLPTEQLAWQWSSGAFAAFIVAEAGVNLSRMRRLRRIGHPIRHPRLAVAIFWAPGAYLLTLQVRNAATWGADSVYAAGLIWILSLAMLQFLLLVTSEFTTVSPIRGGHGPGTGPQSCSHAVVDTTPTADSTDRTARPPRPKGRRRGRR